MKIGVYGGSFDPIHVGHLMIAEEAYHALGLSKVLFIPAYDRPGKKSAHGAAAAQRYAMVKAAVRGCSRFAVSDIELRRKGVSYTIDTLQELKAVYGPACRMYFIIGADTLPELPTWKEIREVARLCTFAVAMRPGTALRRMDALARVIGGHAVSRMRRSVLRTALMGVSSTDIRARVRDGRSITFLVPPAVERYIRRHRLYAS